MKSTIRLISGAMLLLAANASWANLITNGSFESFVISGSDVNFGSYVRFFSPPANTDLTGWTITGSSGGNPNSVDLVNSALYAAYAGSYSLDMEGAIGASGVISQSFATTTGDTYDLSFAYGNNPYCGGACEGTMNALVTGTGTLLNQDVSHNTSVLFGSMNYSLFSMDFVADSATTTLQFSALTNSGFGVALDAVSVVDVTGSTSVPEPGTLSLFGLSLTGLGFAAFGFMRRCKAS